MFRLAIVVSHPTQYYSPWFRYIARDRNIDLHVYYLWDFGVRRQNDAKFAQDLQWDIDLTSGYESTFVPNIAKTPGTSSFRGLNNPRLPQLLKQWAPDSVLVFGYGWKSLFELTWRYRDGPVILRGDTHNLNPGAIPFGKNLLRKLCLNLLFRRYSAFACVGKSNREFYLENGVSPAKCFTIPHCVDNQRFGTDNPPAAAKWREEVKISDQEFVVLFAGKFERKKRPDLLVEAFKSANLDAARLVMVGSGPLESKLGKQAETMGERAQFLGFINQTQMPAILGAADVLVLPSQGSEETWGLVVNEAMACGTPAIVSHDVGCRKDLIIEGKTGWSFEAGNKTALVHSLRLAHKSWQNDREELRKNVLIHIDSFSYESATTALHQMLAHLNPAKASSSK